MRRRCAEYVMLALLWASGAHGAESERVARLSADWVVYYATVYHVPVELVEAIIEVESGWEPYAVSPNGAVGLMQLMPETAYNFRVRNRFWVEENIRGGVAYLAWLIGLFHGDLRLAVASYYAGERRIMPQKLAYCSPGVYEYVQRVAALYRAKRLAEVQHETSGGNLPLQRSKRNGADRPAAHRVGTSGGRPRDRGGGSDAFCDGDSDAGTRQLRRSRRPVALSGRALGARADLVFVKSLTAGPAESNLLVSTGKSHETSLLLVSRGDNAKDVDFVVSYRRAGSFLVEPDYPSPLVGETVPTTTARVVANPSGAGVATGTVAVRPVSLTTDPQPAGDGSGEPTRRSSLDELLTRQQRAPLPALYGEQPGVENPAGDHVRAGVSEVIDGGQQVIVLFSAVNPTQHAILLVPPQVQLGGKSKRGKLHHSRWTTAEQLVVEDFRLSTRRLAPGERADGVVLFERPPYKQSSETLLLQVAEAGAVDKPALAPIGFGVNKLREEAADGRAK